MRRFLFLLLAISPWTLAEPGSVSRATELKEKPFLDAATVGRLAAEAPVDIQSRQGAWAQVRTATGEAGWLKVLNLRSVAGSTSSGAGLERLARVARTGSSGNTVTTGVKGLSAEQLRNARPDPQQVARLRANAVSAEEAQHFARASQLQAQPVTPLGSSEPTSSERPTFRD